ncbi:UNVERIFIED_CONTAM: hypothetical protein FKN15_007087 [Acipenser sinensis]
MFFLINSASRSFQRVCNVKLLAAVRLYSTARQAGPQTALADEALKIRVSGLSPLQDVTVRAVVTSDDDSMFDSSAQYRADRQGELDLTREPSPGGAFMGVEAMGLLWSLLSCPDGSALAASVQERCSEGTAVRGPLGAPGPVGAWQDPRPGAGPFPGVIDMYGDEGGLTEYRASLLASRGFAALALPYLGREHLPESLSDLDFGYFKQAASFLLHHPKVRSLGLGAVGTGKGAELALAMVTFLPQVVAAVSISGCHANTGGELRYRDRVLPGLSYTASLARMLDSGVLDLWIPEYWTSGFRSTGPLDSGVLDLWIPEYWTSRRHRHRASLIPIEEAEGHFLFVVGEDDRKWKSAAYAAAAVQKLSEGGRHNYRVLSYPGAGHRIDSPFAQAVLDQTLGVPVMEGGQPSAHSHAQAHAWGQIQEFLHSNLGGSCV